VQLATLGLLFTAQGFFWFTLVGLFSGWIGSAIQRSVRLTRVLPFFSATVLILISLYIIVA
jgi:threonine/homoserine/homoserine lactone efflux protein